MKNLYLYRTKLLGLLFSIFCALALTACFSDGSMHGGDDYPNSMEPLGRHAANERGDSSDWNAYQDAPNGATGMYDTNHVPDSPPSESAPKRGATALSLPSLDVALGSEIAGSIRVVQSTLDTGTGIRKAIRTQSVASVLFTSVDTTWYLPSGSGFSLLRVSGKVSFGGDVRYSVYEDGDGDGVLSPVLAGSVAKIRFTTVTSSGLRDERIIRKSAGPDKDFNKSNDNALVALQRVSMQAVDTLLSLLLTDVDGDGYIFNPLRDSSRIGVESRVSNSSGRTNLSYRFNAFTDSNKNYAYRYSKVFTSARGVEETNVFGRDSLPDFSPRDTGSVRVHFTSTVSTDTLSYSDSRYTVRLSPIAGSTLGNLLIKVEREKTFRTGDVSGYRFTLKPESSVPNGSFARTGALFIRADLRAGGWVQFTGQAGADISGTVTDSEGRSGTVHFQLDGKVKSASGF